MMALYDLVVVGAGPAGLATAIAAKKRNLSCLVLEKGAVVNTLLHFPTNMVFFTTPELLEIGGLPFVTPYDKPTRLESLRYYRRVVDTYALAIDLDETVESVAVGEGVEDAGETRETHSAREAGNVEARTLVVRTHSVRRGERRIRARSVVIATGAYDLPNLVGIPGEDLPHVSHYYSESHPYYRKRVIVVGGANSTADAALDLYRSGAHVTIVHRRPEFSASIKYWVKPDLENRIKEGSIAARMEAHVTAITPATVTIAQQGRSEELPADAVFLLTGYHSDTTLFEHTGIHFDRLTLTPDFDPETFETNVPGLYVVGQVTTGRQSGRIFIENGRFHGERVVEVIARRLAPSDAASELVSRS
jgi:thioredoxin reductase (NADPH)